jgi:hypothetical protein
MLYHDFQKEEICFEPAAGRIISILTAIAKGFERDIQNGW